MQYYKFQDIIRRKERLATDLYLSDKDLFTEAKNYIAQLNEIFSEV